ncbi:hypothetical protein EON82_06230 [bacterium]|nr:MAG: hypothetical protein EON82_06230 [bacterium]
MSFALSLAADVVEVDAGATTPLGLTIVNTGATTDRFEVEVEGIDLEWRFIPVPTFAVEPSATVSEKIFLKPPRVPESVAGSYPFVVRVRSLETGEAKIVQGLLKLLPFHHLTMEISPKKGVVSPTTKRNDYRLTLVNLGNSEHTLQLSAQDPDDRCAYEFESDQIVLGPGQQREVEMIADPKQTPLLSSGRLIGFSAIARSLNERTVSATAQAQLEQRSLLSPATLVALALIAAILGAWWAMRPKPPEIDLSVVPRHALAGTQIQVSYVAQNADHVKITASTDEPGKEPEVIYDGPANNPGPFPYVLKGSGQVMITADAEKDGKPVHDSEPVTIDVPPVVPAAEITGLKASDRRIRLGTSFVLSWKVKNATKVAIAPIADNLSPDLEQYSVTPTTTGEQTYTFIAFNEAGKSVKKTVTVEVYDESDAQIVSFSANPKAVKESEGGKTVLSWHVTNADHVELTIGSDAPIAVSPDEPGREVTIGAKTTFILTAFDTRARRVARKVTVNFEKTEVVIEPSTTGGTPPTDPPIPDTIPPP